VENQKIPEVLLHKGDPVIQSGSENEYHLPGTWVNQGTTPKAAALQLAHQLGCPTESATFLKKSKERKKNDRRKVYRRLVYRVYCQNTFQQPNAGFYQRKEVDSSKLDIGLDHDRILLSNL